jgi:hypothetical protein
VRLMQKSGTLHENKKKKGKRKQNNKNQDQKNTALANFLFFN